MEVTIVIKKTIIEPSYGYINPLNIRDRLGSDRVDLVSSVTPPMDPYRRNSPWIVRTILKIQEEYRKENTNAFVERQIIDRSEKRILYARPKRPC